MDKLVIQLHITHYKLKQRCSTLTRADGAATLQIYGEAASAVIKDGTAVNPPLNLSAVPAQFFNYLKLRFTADGRIDRYARNAAGYGKIRA